jgi:hypothetical protein
MSCDKYVPEIEHEVYGHQEKSCKIIQEFNKPEKGINHRCSNAD